MKLHKLLNIGLLSITPIICLTSITACGPNGEEEDPTKCKLTLDANGGTFFGSDTASLKISKYKSYSEIKENIVKPTRNLYKFKGYGLDKTTVLDDWYQFTDTSKTLYAVWEQQTTVNITFDANGGSFEQGSTIQQQIVSGTSLKDVSINKPTYEGYVFNGWTIDKQVVLDDDYTLKADLTLNANWLDQSTTCTLTVDKNLDVEESTTISVPKGTVIGTITPDFTREYYSFRCFGDAQGKQISKNFIVKEDFNCKVWWKSDGTSEETLAEDYIHNRSFSITGDAGGIGTCWIISDATPGVLDDYVYYIATNLHVRTNIETATTYKFTDTKEVITSVESSQFVEFNGFVWEEKAKSFYETGDVVDLSIAKADFSKATGDTKTKLDNLNKRQKIEGCITEFADSVSQDKHYETSISNIATAGYGARNESNDGYQWESHQYLPLRFAYDDSALQHGIDDGKTYMDVSPQYVLNIKEEVDWMRPGASGSMVAGWDSADNTWKVLGIYWGGFSKIQGGTTGLPCFSCFNSDKKNFIDDYCTYHINY